jgi:hypothetical protein
MVFWDSTGGISLTELVGDFAVFLKVFLALAEEALTDHAAVDGNGLVFDTTYMLPCVV